MFVRALTKPQTEPCKFKVVSGTAEYEGVHIIATVYRDVVQQLAQGHAIADKNAGHDGFSPWTDPARVCLLLSQVPGLPSVMEENTVKARVVNPNCC